LRRRFATDRFVWKHNSMRAPLRGRTQSTRDVLQPFVLQHDRDRPGHLCQNHHGRLRMVLERPVFIEISPARSVAVKLLPAPCRGVVPKPGTHMHNCTNVPSPVTNQAYPFFTMSETLPYGSICVLCFTEFLICRSALVPIAVRSSRTEKGSQPNHTFGRYRPRGAAE